MVNHYPVHGGRYADVPVRNFKKLQEEAFVDS